MTQSDAETVIEEDSPLSPCLWTEGVANQRPRNVNLLSRTTSTTRDKSLQRELQLSPASQLNVLSQISELADVPSRQTGIMSRLTQQTPKRSNVWGAALQMAKRRKTLQQPAKKTGTTSKRHMHKSMQSQTERLSADMLDWETCSEGDLFTFDVETEEDQWTYEEIDDSDFEGELRTLHVYYTNVMTRREVPPVDDDGSISDVFTDMLNVNEDLIAATAECQVEGDIEGLMAYQCILHRDLMEMAEFIDSIFGVYSNTYTHTPLLSQMKNNESELAQVAEDKAFAPARETSATAMKKKGVRKTAQRGALLTAIEAGEKVRETRRSKEQWIKSRHQVLEEEGVSAIMNSNTNGMVEVASTQSGEKEPQQGGGGLALANQLRAHQHIAPFFQAFKETAGAGSLAPINLLLANQIAMHPAVSPLAIPAPLLQVPPMPVTTIAAAEKPIKPCTAGNCFPKIALPPARSLHNMVYTFPGGALPLMFNPQVTAGFMPMPPWQQQLSTALPARTVVVPARTPAKMPEFKRMCESCRKRHFSVRQCRLVLQHTDPEWQPAQPPTANRRRRRKRPASNTTSQATSTFQAPLN